MTVLLWFRTDLRLLDHQPLTRACQQGSPLIPLYCLDPRQFGETSLGLRPRTGPFRGQFLLESLADLRQQLRSRGSDLVIRQGQPEHVIPTLAQEWGVKAVYAHEEVGTEEKEVAAAVERALQPLGIPLQVDWGHTLYHPEDLPFCLSQLPELFTRFRKQVEESTPIRDPLPIPAIPPLPSGLDPGPLPTLASLGLSSPARDPRARFTYLGGSTAAHARLQTYFWDLDRLRLYKETRNGMLDPDDSSRLSAWLALGCISPRTVYAEVKRYEQERVRNESTYWLVFELLWRDYFRFILAKHGAKLFRPSGIQGIPIPWQQDWPRFQAWCRGETGYPLVDANMRELAATGFMSNRGRQNVASFLTKNLGIDWRMGAEWFESLLIDYDVASNYGNWNYTAGVGNDARGFRYFHIPKQSREYDPKGGYLRHWLPELAGIPGDKIHEPYRLTAAEQKQFGVRLGVDYPRPLVDLEKSLAANRRVYEAALACR
ncbi:DASH family cryptochrome [Synechococcus sp. W55.1]|uniref:DASH family cryptochrome n=1 Tax=Synechococcus sp. W55.1 TaxID=2964512 RepID=UPI0039C3DA87